MSFSATIACMKSPQEILKKVFGYENFKPLQEEIITSLLGGRDTLAVMPTGGGKSLCYQIPALIFKGLTIVVSPLIALMEDQVSALKVAGVHALFLNSTLDRESYKRNTELIVEGSVKLVYLAPESLFTDRVQEIFAEVRVDCVTIDEAHCISDWGHDFRPEYRRIAELRTSFPKAVVLALTATATERVRNDIKKNLKLSSPAQFVASFNRPNIFLEVQPKKNPTSQVLAFLQTHKKESGIIYCFSRKQVDELCADLCDHGYQALPYHAGLSDASRKKNQECFIRDDIHIIVATLAFGMGINKPNVRFVIHYDLPKSPEQYYQEIGRAGRDGNPARALLLYGFGDTRKIRFFLEEKEGAELRCAEEHLKAMTFYADARTCRRKILLAWFGENWQSDSIGPCCDLCSKPPAMASDVTTHAQKILSCILRTSQRYGASYVIDILLGSKQKRIIENAHHKLSTFGIGKNLSKDDWFEISRLLTENGYLVKDEQYGVLSLTQDAKEALSKREPILLPFSLSASCFESEKKLPLKNTDLNFYTEQRILTLKKLRKEIALAEDVPAYVIFSDRTLNEIAEKKPSNTAALLEIHGIGKVKAERYGDSIVRALL